jgi:glycosyltransferase involved in cell wall biosynthesis
MGTKVSFVVPCYNYGKYLRECVESILCQTYGDFEVLVMDNSSSDNTPDVARSFRDRRLTYVRNETNLGHIRNFNKGVEMARGQYVWVISADDCLHKPCVLEKYVRVLDANPSAGFVFCPVIKVENDVEQGIHAWFSHGTADAVFRGRDFLARMVDGNHVGAPSVMARTECYAKVGLFCPELPYTCDWHLWSLFALHYDVAYLAEPMVRFRFHSSNVTLGFEGSRHGVQQKLLVRWRIRAAALDAGHGAVARQFEDALVSVYVDHLIAGLEGDEQLGLTAEELEADLSRELADPTERERFRSRVRAAQAARYEPLGDHHYLRRDLAKARRFYELAAAEKGTGPSSRAKLALLRLGPFGDAIRRVAALRHR